MTIKLLDIKSTDCIRTFEGHPDIITCVKKAPGNRVISEDTNDGIKILNIDTGECIKTIATDVDKDVFKVILILSDNKRFASYSYDEI